METVFDSDWLPFPRPHLPALPAGKGDVRSRLRVPRVGSLHGCPSCRWELTGETVPVRMGRTRVSVVCRSSWVPAVGIPECWIYLPAGESGVCICTKERFRNNFPILAADDRSIQGATRSACPGIDGTGGNGDNRIEVNPSLGQPGVSPRSRQRIAELFHSVDPSVAKPCRRTAGVSPLVFDSL